MEYDYKIVSDLNTESWHIEQKLKAGWRVQSAIATHSSVHYILAREVPAPEPPTESDISEPQYIPSAIDDAPDEPINLTDIPF